MIVVSDSSPLITLAKIGRLNLLPQLFGRITIPTEVERELIMTGPQPGTVDLWPLMADWIEVKTPLSTRVFLGLHSGETAAISLAIETNAKLLIDEKSGRSIAEAHGVAVIGTVGILIEAARLHLTDLENAFQQLKSTNFRFPHASLDVLLREFNAQSS